MSDRRNGRNGIGIISIYKRVPSLECTIVTVRANEVDGGGPAAASGSWGYGLDPVFSAERLKRRAISLLFLELATDEEVLILSTVDRHHAK